MEQKRPHSVMPPKQEGKGQCMPQKGQQHSIDKSRQLQYKLYLAAKKDKQRRFHARENKGSAGIEGITFEMIEEYGAERI